MKHGHEDFAHCAECDSSGRDMHCIEFARVTVYLCWRCFDALRNMLSSEVKS